ncbi:MAG: TonB-dependent receptor [Rhodocyclaceae bacterium]|nr:TonB-dependent receptor [Rhodocyclaceae bacterium]
MTSDTFRRAEGLLALTALVPWAGWAHAESTESLFYDDVPIVLTASRLAQSAYEAPAPVTVIDRELIEASGFTELHDLLRLVPGFQVADWATGSPTVANHGMGDAYGRRIKVLVDGRTVNNSFWGNVHWQDLPLRVDDVERVEVVRGPNGAAYGANAYQGVVNFITRSPRTESRNSAILRAGHRELTDIGVRLNGGEEQLDWRVTASRRAAVNFLSFDGEAAESIERNVANLQVLLQPTLADEIRIQAGSTVGFDDTGIPDSLTEPLGKRRIKENYLQLGWLRNFGPESELSVQFYHQDRAERKHWVIPAGAFDVPVMQDIDLQRDDLEVQFTRRLDDAWHVLVGTGVRRDATRSILYFSSDRPEIGVQWQVFSSLTWQATEHLSVNVGGNLEHHYYSGKLFSPRLALTYSLAPRQSLRFSTGTAYRAPQAWEARSFTSVSFADQILAITYWARGEPEPERVRFMELGYNGRLESLGLDLDARAFRERFDRYIDDRACSFPPTSRNIVCDYDPPANFLGLLGRTAVNFVNAGAIVVDGIELRADWRREGWGRVVATQSFVNITARGDAPQDPDLVHSAPASMSTLVLIKDLTDHWRTSVGYYYSTEMRWLNDGDVVPSHGRTDLKLARLLGPNGRDGELAATVQSLEGAYADFHEGNFRHEPTLFATLRLSW